MLQPSPSSPGWPCYHKRRIQDDTSPATAWEGASPRSATVVAADEITHTRQRHRLSRRRQRDNPASTPG